jgi:serine/threonine protein kinase
MNVQAAHRDPEIQRLLDRALDDQRSSWIRGERIPVEEYLARDPALRDDPDAILDLIYQEYLLLRERGETPDPHEFTARFPELAEAILVQFGVDAAMPTTFKLPADGHPPGTTDTASTRRIDDYEVLAVLGQGGMGVVYKARDASLGRMVAIKTLAEGQHATPEQLERFRAEAQAVARLRHPNIIAIHVIGEHEGRPYLSLEFAEGGSLAQRLADKPMPPREAAELLEALARAVHAAHQAGVVHRDLKPSNVLLDADGVPKVADFGLAKLLDSDSGRTLSGQVVGTPSYMAPEQAEGQSKRVGPAADIYALGAILYHALTGRPPFLGESAMETIRLATSTEAVPPRQLRPDVPLDLETICLKCLEKESARRYPGALALAEDLHRYLDGRPIAARPVGPVGRLWRWGRRNPWVAGLAATLLLTFVLGTPTLFVLWLQARTDRARAEFEAANAKAINEFLTKDLLGQASAYNQVQPDPDVKVRTVLDRAAEQVDQRFANQPLVQASIRRTIGETYQQLGLYPQARKHLLASLDIRRRTLGDAHPDTLLAQVALGSLDFADYKLAEAQPLLEGAMEQLERVRGPEHPDTLDAIHLVGQLHWHQNKTDAERLVDRVRTAYLRTKGPDDPKTLAATHDLALMYKEQGESMRAETLFKDVVERLRRTRGETYPNTLEASNNLANLYGSLGRQAELQQILEKVVEAELKVLGPNHAITVKSLHDLGSLYKARGLLDKAEDALKKAAEGAKAVLDPNNELRAAALVQLADIYNLKGKVKDVGPALVEARDIWRHRHGADDGITANANQALGKYYLLKEPAKAEEYLREAWAWWIKAEPNHWNRFGAEARLGASLLRQKKYAEAESWLLSAYRGMKAHPQGINTPNQAELRWTIEQIIVLSEEAGPFEHKAEFQRVLSDPEVRQTHGELRFPGDPFAPPSPISG